MEEKSDLLIEWMGKNGLWLGMEEKSDLLIEWMGKNGLWPEMKKKREEQMAENEISTISSQFTYYLFAQLNDTVTLARLIAVL
ncbi:hypothetical protein VNO77_04153 [Canavalia gladiata]|uniref:Uncharacterized protein n=1 Tax=Canavalia gladiata TaxID=3824 RepID=A0AAN9N159_CANGL